MIGSHHYRFVRKLLIWFSLAGIIGSLGYVAFGQPAASKSEVLFRKEVGPSEFIVVSREPVDAEDLGFLGWPLAHDHRRAYLLKAEIQVPGKPVHLLAAAAGADYGEFGEGFNVLDVVPQDNEVIVVCTVRDVVGLWRFTIDLAAVEPQGWAWLYPVRMVLQTIEMLKKDDVRVTLTRLPPMDWAVTIENKLTGKTLHFKQDRRLWGFDLLPETEPEKH